MTLTHDPKHVRECNSIIYVQVSLLWTRMNYRGMICTCITLTYIACLSHPEGLYYQCKALYSEQSTLFRLLSHVCFIDQFYGKCRLIKLTCFSSSRSRSLAFYRESRYFQVICCKISENTDDRFMDVGSIINHLSFRM